MSGGIRSCSVALSGFLRNFIAAGTKVRIRNTPTFSSGFSESPVCTRISCDCDATCVTCCERNCIPLGSRGGSPTIQSVWPVWSGCVTCHMPGPAYSPVTMISSSGSSDVWAWEISGFSPQASASTIVRVSCMRNLSGFSRRHGRGLFGVVVRHAKQPGIRLGAMDVAELVARLTRARIAIGGFHHDLQLLAVPLLRRHVDGLLVADGAGGNGGFDTAARGGFAIHVALPQLYRRGDIHRQAGWPRRAD